MGGLSSIARAGIAASITGIGAGMTLHLSSAHHQRVHRAHDERNAGRVGDARERLPDDVMSNLDGWLRIGALAGAAGSALVAGASLLARKPQLAFGALGVGTALAGSALLAGTSPLGERVQHNLGAAGGALSSAIHVAHLPERPTVQSRAEQLAPAPEATDITPRPTATQLRNARLSLPGTVDHELARTNAQKAIEAIDWSKRDIVLWMAGTGSHEQSGHWIRGVAETPDAFGGGGSAVLVDYPASADFEPSVATGMETLRLVLAAIAERGGDEHRVLLGGHSQGAWVIGDAMATPEIHAMVDRAVLMGHPGIATHDYADGHDPKVLELNDPKDPITRPSGNRQALIAGMRAYDQGISAETMPALLGTALTHPDLTAFWLARSLDHERWGPVDPHYYDYAYADALSWLDAAPTRD